MNLAPTIIPKSDQLNADDLITGPITIKVTLIKPVERDGQRAFDVYFEGDDGKPFKPCKSMRRVIIALWGSDGNKFIGRSMTLFRDDNVIWGGLKVGGIRISHMSHIERDIVMALTVSKAQRKPYTVKVLTVAATPAKVDPVAAINDAKSLDELAAVWKSLSADEKVAASEAKDKRKEELTTGA